MATENGISIRQIIIGAAVLLVGVLIYLIDRPPDQTYFIYKFGMNINLFGVLPIIFGPIGNFLPSFIHVFSFIFLTAGLIAHGKRDYLIICLSWLLIDCAFELGQKFKSWPSRIIPDWFVSIPFLENTKNYFIQGTFDLVDLIAIVIGVAIAYLFLVKTRQRGSYGKE